jgi:nucleoside-diphosphate-sugar epimerase
MLDGHEVFVVDNYFTGRKRNIEQWLGHENFEVLHHDIVNPLFIGKYLNIKLYVHFFHLFRSG